MKLAIIVAMAQNGVIGQGGKIPWRIPSDMKHFVELTAGHPVIMGRKTYESIPPKFRPLDKDRVNIVLSRHGVQSEILVTDLRKGIVIATNLDTALDEAIIADDQVVFIAGGSKIYELMLPLANIVYLTRVCAEVEGDSFFPRLPENEWKTIEWIKEVQDSKDQFPIVFETLIRR
ncbi:MAG: dihydrofolate reductase [bacterium]|nr:dihydrofolate reductase [bacterium]